MRPNPGSVAATRRIGAAARPARRHHVLVERPGAHPARQQQHRLSRVRRPGFGQVPVHADDAMGPPVCEPVGRWPTRSRSSTGDGCIAFSFDDIMRYHGPSSPGGAAHAFKVLERALPLLDPTAPASAARSSWRPPSAGPGARDAFEMVTRAVTGDRYRVDPALARPERGRTLERFVFRLGYRDRSATLALARGLRDRRVHRPRPHRRPHAGAGAAPGRAQGGHGRERCWRSRRAPSTTRACDDAGAHGTGGCMAGRFDATTVIDRPIEEVFAFLADGTNDPKFSPRVLEIAKTTDGPPGVGTVYASTVKDGGVKTKREFELTEFEAPTRIRWKELSKNSITVPEGGYDLAPEGDGTRVTLHNVVRGARLRQADRPARAARGAQGRRRLRSRDQVGRRGLIDARDGGSPARARVGARLRRRPREGLLLRAGGLQRRSRPPGQRRDPLRPADPAWIRLLDRHRDRAHRHGARVPAGAAGRGRRRRGRAGRAGRERRGGERGAGLPVGPVRVLRRPGRQRLVRAAGGRARRASGAATAPPQPPRRRAAGRPRRPRSRRARRRRTRRPPAPRAPACRACHR